MHNSYKCSTVSPFSAPVVLSGYVHYSHWALLSGGIESEAMKTELEIRRACIILRKHVVNAVKRDRHAAAAAGSALSALMWAIGDDGEYAAAFEELMVGTGEDLRGLARRN